MTAETHSIDAEHQVLGAILINNDALDKVSGILREDHFFEPIHREIFRCCRQLVEAGKLASPLTIRTFFPANLAVGELSFGEYIARIAASATAPSYVKDYASIIRDLYDRRCVIDVGIQIAEGSSPNAVEVATWAIDELDKVVSDRLDEGVKPSSFKEAAVKALDAAASAYQRDGAIIGLSWGVSDLDAKTLGAQPGNLIVVAGRPGMGKTAFMLSAASAMSAPTAEFPEGRPGAVFSLEMSDSDLAARMIARQSYLRGAPVSYWKIKSGRFAESDFNGIVESFREIENTPIHIEQQPGLSLSQVAARARQAKRRHGLHWLAVDHIGLMSMSDRYRGNRASEVGELTAGLKSLAKELNVPVLALCQLSRQVEGRDDKRPRLSDLRDSGSIEQDADVVLMLYRKSYYLERSEPLVGTPEYIKWLDEMETWANKIDIQVEKQRSGPVGTVRCFADMASNVISNLSEPKPSPAPSSEVVEFFA